MKYFFLLMFLFSFITISAQYLLISLENFNKKGVVNQFISLEIDDSNTLKKDAIPQTKNNKTVTSGIFSVCNF